MLSSPPQRRSSTVAPRCSASPGVPAAWARLWRLGVLFAAAAAAGGCTSSEVARDGSPVTAVTAAGQSDVPARVVIERTYAAPEECATGFVAHRLAHVTKASGPVVGYYDSNGAGLATADLDDDGDLDLVLANLNGPNVVAWNEGALRFREQALPLGGSRGVAVVDLDGDGGRDLVFTQGYGSLLVYRDHGGGPDVGRYRRATLAGVRVPAYAMDWADVDGDGDLDLATASYDTMLEKDLRDTFLFGTGAGVALYRNDGDRFTLTRLAQASQALAVAFFDVDDDGWPDLLVGNDFETPDFVFANPGRDGGTWRSVEPFAVTTRNTMSFVPFDVDRDGRLDLFATDMKPAFDRANEIAAWLPLLERGYQTRRESERQIAENVLLLRGGDGYRNVAYRQGVDATGWSWSAAFGDLDLDGRPDLYVVNGMIAREAFPHLDGHALVEANRAFRGTPSGGFAPALEWGLGDVASGRGMVFADLDDDGDLDVAVNALEAPATVFENRLCRAGTPLAVDLRWPGSGNTYAVGARLTIVANGIPYVREVRGTSGYLSGPPARLHLGLPDGVAIERAWVVWPDGGATALEGLSPGVRAIVVRDVAPKAAR